MIKCIPNKKRKENLNSFHGRKKNQIQSFHQNHTSISYPISFRATATLTICSCVASGHRSANTWTLTNQEKKNTTLNSKHHQTSKTTKKTHQREQRFPQPNTPPRPLGKSFALRPPLLLDPRHQLRRHEPDSLPKIQLPNTLQQSKILVSGIPPGASSGPFDDGSREEGLEEHDNEEESPNGAYPLEVVHLLRKQEPSHPGSRAVEEGPTTRPRRSPQQRAPLRRQHHLKRTHLQRSSVA